MKGVFRKIGKGFATVGRVTAKAAPVIARDMIGLPGPIPKASAPDGPQHAGGSLTTYAGLAMIALACYLIVSTEQTDLAIGLLMAGVAALLGGDARAVAELIDRVNRLEKPKGPPPNG
jgi:hypothetical protein